MIDTATLTGSVQQWTRSGTIPARKVTVQLTPTVDRIANSETGSVVLLEELTAVPDDGGRFTIEVPASDAAGFSPSGWTWKIRILTPGHSHLPFSAVLSAGVTHHLAELVPVDSSEGQPVLRGPAGPRGTVWHVSGHPHTDYVQVPDPASSDLFLYPGSGDLFRYDGAEWAYLGSLGARTA